jgi:hypothetical protein
VRKQHPEGDQHRAKDQERGPDKSLPMSGAASHQGNKQQYEDDGDGRQHGGGDLLQAAAAR